jgi:hypothetical protein
VNTRNLIDYIAPHGNVRSSFILTTPENGHCANKATFFAGYGKDLYRKDDSLDAPEGPLMDAASIGRETMLPYPLHPPFAAVTFWNRLRHLVQSGHGYITADQLDMAFQTGLHITQPSGKQSITRVLRGRVDWYLPLRYSAYGPDLSADSHNTAGPRSYVDIELTTYTFRDERGRPNCLSARHVEEDLLADGWKETSSLFSDTDKENGRGSKILVFPNTGATIRLSIEAYTPNRCLLNIRIQSLDPSVR